MEKQRLLKKIERLEAREKALVSENRALKAELDKANAVFDTIKKSYVEYMQGIEDLKILKAKYKDAIKAANKEKKKVRSEFMKWIKMVRKTAAAEQNI